MIAFYTSIAILVFMITLVYLEIVSRTYRALPLSGVAGRVTGSPNLSLVLYESLATSIIIDFHVLIEETRHPFLVEAFPLGLQVFIGLFVVLGVLLDNYIRFNRWGRNKRNTRRIYYMAAANAEEHESPEAGLQEAITLVNELSARNPAATEHGLLEYLSVRTDALGEAARRKLSEV